MAGIGGFYSSVEKAGIGPGCWDDEGGGIVDGAAYLLGVMRGWAGAQGWRWRGWTFHDGGASGAQRAGAGPPHDALPSLEQPSGDGARG
jgi:hypothetical protein